MAGCKHPQALLGFESEFLKWCEFELEMEGETWRERRSGRWGVGHHASLQLSPSPARLLLPSSCGPGLCKHPGLIQKAHVYLRAHPGERNCFSTAAFGAMKLFLRG